MVTVLPAQIMQQEQAHQLFNVVLELVVIVFSSNVRFLATTQSISNTIAPILITGGLGVRGTSYTGSIKHHTPSSNGITFPDFSTLVTSNNITAGFLQATIR
jgi:hypothetical protein